MKKVFLPCLAGLFLFIFATFAEAQTDPRDLPTDLPTNLEQNPEYRWTPLHWAVRRGQTEKVEELVARGNLEERDFLGRTPLHIAVLSGHDDIVQLLIAKGADVNAADQWKVTPLRRAELLQETREWDRSQIAQLLRDAGGVSADLSGIRE